MTTDEANIAVEGTDQELLNTVSSLVYAATGIIEKAESEGRIAGNGHHIRQRIATAAVEIVRERLRDRETRG